MKITPLFFLLFSLGYLPLKASQASLKSTSCLGSLCFWKKSEEQIRAAVEKKKIIAETKWLAQEQQVLNDTLKRHALLPKELIAIILSYNQLMYTGHKGPVLSLTLLDGTTFASGGKDKKINIWSLENSQRLPKTLIGHKEPVSALGVLPSGNLVSVSSVHGNAVSLFSTLANAPTDTQNTTDSELRLSTYTMSDTLSRPSDEPLRIWDPTQNAQNALLACIEPDRKVADAKRLAQEIVVAKHAVATAYGATCKPLLSRVQRVWNITKQAHEFDVSRLVCLHNDLVPKIPMSCEPLLLVSGQLLTGWEDGSIRVINQRDQLMTAQSVLVLQGHTGPVRVLSGFTVATADCTICMISGSDDGTIKVWDKNGRCKQTIYGHTGPILTLAVRGQHHIISGSADGTIRVDILE